MSNTNGERAPMWPEPDDAAIADARAKSPTGEIQELRAGLEVLIVRPPTSGEYRRFRDMIWDDKKKSRSVEVLVRDCVLYPDSRALSELLDRWPALAERIGDKVLELARAADELESKPL